MSEVIPLFYDHSSYKSILTFWEPKDCLPNGPKSIVSLCKDAKLKECVFISKNFATLPEAWKNLKAEKINLFFGIEMIMCDDAKIHTDESRRNEHKIIIFFKNQDGYRDLLKLYSACNTDPENKYYVMRFDYKQLKKYWTNNLMMALPFFDSFVARNLLGFGTTIVPDLSFTKPVIFREKNSGLPFEPLINEALNRFNPNKEYKEQFVKTIYYGERKDFKAYMAYRCILNRSTYTEPELRHFSSQEFCFESWKEIVGTIKSEI